MGSIIGYLTFALGTLLMLGGTYMAFANMGTMTPVLAWGVVALIGIFVWVNGLSSVLSESGESDVADPNDAPGKTDSPFGRR